MFPKSGSIYGQLMLDITQSSYSMVPVEDVDPLEIRTFFGNIGGFWGSKRHHANLPFCFEGIKSVAVLNTRVTRPS